MSIKQLYHLLIQSKMFFLMVFVSIVIIGMSFVLSATYTIHSHSAGGHYYFFIKQLAWLFMSIFCLFLVYKMPLEWLKYSLPFVFIICLMSMILTFFPHFSVSIYGARRWLKVSIFSFQPSELVKLTLILYLSYLFDKKENHPRGFLNFFLPPFLVVIFFTFLIIFQNDYSTALLVFATCLVIFYFARVKIFHLVLGLFYLCVFSLLAIIFVPHRINRIISYFNPESHTHTFSYQYYTAQQAISHGHLLGSGLGSGVWKNSVPEIQSDYIFTVVAEEWGFLGVIFVLALFCLLFWQAYCMLSKVNRPLYYYMGMGILCGLAFQTFMNIAVVSGLLPPTGIPLPFFSLGGSSLLISSIMIGLLMNIWAHQDESVKPSFFGEDFQNRDGLD